ncbi:unnamed protein product [Ixodes pacificus]
MFLPIRMLLQDAGPASRTPGIGTSQLPRPLLEQKKRALHIYGSVALKF